MALIDIASSKSVCNCPLAELKRQYNSSLYERVALSTDKDKVYRLSLEGQKVETAKAAGRTVVR